LRSGRGHDLRLARSRDRGARCAGPVRAAIAAASRAAREEGAAAQEGEAEDVDQAALASAGLAGRAQASDLELPGASGLRPGFGFAVPVRDHHAWPMASKRK